MTKLQAIRWFADFVAEEHVVIERKDDWEFNMAYSHPHMGIPYDPMKRDQGDKLFRADFVARCPLARGFADVTLSILHEIGHHFNREEFIFMTNVKEYNEAEGLDHFKFPCERVATDWAIAWLQDPTHRKIAKAFEKDFFTAKR